MHTPKSKDDGRIQDEILPITAKFYWMVFAVLHHYGHRFPVATTIHNYNRSQVLRRIEGPPEIKKIHQASQ
jgi:hypothetical protein